MITEAFLRTHDKWGKYLTGLTAPRFWSMFSRIEADFEEYERQRHERPDRKRAGGAGRPFAAPLLIRVVAASRICGCIWHRNSSACGLASIRFRFRVICVGCCQGNCSGMRLKPRLRGRFAPGDRLRGRRGSVHAELCGQGYR